MKRTLTILALATIGMTTLFSCSKTDSKSTTTSGGSGAMTATINGAAFNGSKCYAIISGGTLTVTGGSAGSGTALSMPYVTFSILNYTGTGTYSLGSVPSGTNSGGIDSSATATGVAGAIVGTINVTAVSSTTVTGTFSFTCMDNTTVTGGTFTGAIQ